MRDKYAVIGNPIQHSKSPFIHSAFAEQTGEDMVYIRLLGDLDDFEGDVRRFFQQGGRGLNVTLPFKQQAFRLADELSDLAGSAGAVNTLIQLDDGRIRGENTDGLGLIRDLTVNHGFLLSGSRILLLGAGGASRGVARPLLESGPEQLLIANRTASKAEALAEELSVLGDVEGCGLDQLDGRQFDLIINGTAAGLTGTLPDIPDTLLAPGGIILFVAWGKTGYRSGDPLSRPALVHLISKETLE